MLSSVLSSKKAIAVNIQIMRIFTKMRELLLSNKDLLLEMDKIRKKVVGQDEKIEMIFSYLQQFIREKEKPRKNIGFQIIKLIMLLQMLSLVSRYSIPCSTKTPPIWRSNALAQRLRARYSSWKIIKSMDKKCCPESAIWRWPGPLWRRSPEGKRKGRRFSSKISFGHVQ